MKSRMMLLAVLLTGATVTGAQAQGWNISVMGGETWSPHLSVGGVPSAVDNGFNAGGRLGYDLDSLTGLSGLSTAADIFYTQSDYRHAGEGRLSSLSFMGDLIYRVDLGLPVGVYGGAGVGGVRTMVNNLTTDSGSTV